MIFADIVSNLGNQLFIYAATRCIARDLSQPYRYRVIRPSFALSDQCTDAHGHEYRSDFELAFHVPEGERMEQLPMGNWREWEWRRLTDTNYNPQVYSQGPDIHLTGYFLSPRYFERRRDEVLQWFRFRESYLVRARATLEELARRRNVTHFVSVHVRRGDFRTWGLALHLSYQARAMEEMRRRFPKERLCFLLFSDMAESRRLCAGRDVVVQRGSMFDDLCLMTLCDSHIVTNSTFSWWGAWLARERKGIVLRPSLYPLPGWRRGPLDIYPAEWQPVEAHRECAQLFCMARRRASWTARAALRFARQCASAARSAIPAFR